MLEYPGLLQFALFLGLFEYVPIQSSISPGPGVLISISMQLLAIMKPTKDRTLFWILQLLT